MMKKLYSLILSATIITTTAGFTYKQPPNNLTMDTTRTVVTLSSPNDIQAIKNKIPEADVKLLKNNQAIVYSNKLSEKDLTKKLSTVKEVKKSKKPDRVKAIQPYEKQLVTAESIKKRSTTVSPTTTIATNDPYRNYEWQLTDTLTSSAWQNVKQVRQIKVAVVDTGVDYTHPDLANRIDTDNMFNFVKNIKDAKDDNSHGTHVAGIIAASSNNGIGVAGVTGTLDVKILPVKVLDQDGYGDSDIIAQGIQYAVDKGADIINVSLGGRGQAPEIDAAISYAVQKGVFMAVAAGNDNSNTAFYFPANNPNVFTVSAYDKNDYKAYFSNYGTNVKVGAPGVNILSTVPGGYAFMSGTSMAAPVVSGIAAIVKAQYPNLTPSQLTQVLDKSAVDLGSKGFDIYYGYGKLNTVNALSMASTIQ